MRRWPPPNFPPVERRSCANGHPSCARLGCANGHPAVRRRPPLRALVATLFFLQMTKFARRCAGSGARYDTTCSTAGSSVRARPSTRSHARAVPGVRADAAATGGRACASVGAADSRARGARLGRRAGGGAAVRRAGVQVLLRRAWLSAAAGGGGESGGDGGDEHASAGRGAGGASP